MNPSQQQRSRIKLAGTYLAIIMTMSILFSFVLYNVSSHELDRSLRRIPESREPRDVLSETFDAIRRIRLEESRTELQKKLVLFNLVTLLFGAMLSYILAREALRPIEETLDAQQRFTSDASHELRTPLTAMRSEIEVTLRDKKLTTKEARETLTSTLEEITKLEALTAGLLQLARHEQTDSTFVKLDLKEIVKTAVDSLEPLANDKKISINQASVKQLNVRGEPTSLQQVLVILIDNAIKYSSKESTITVTSFSNRHDHGIIVKDQGVGIPKNVLPHVFDRFYRGDTSRTKTTGSENGYGLGLAIAKQITDLHHGSLQITSQIGKGTTVKLSLPKS